MEREKSARNECTRKNIERYRNKSVSEPKILPSCMQSGFQNVPKYSTSDHELRSSLSVNTKCECVERVLKVKNVRSIKETETYYHAKVCTIGTTNNVDRRKNEHFDLKGKENLEDAILKIQQRESHVKAKQVCTGIRIMIMFLFLAITCFEMWSRGTLTIVLFSGVIVITTIAWIIYKQYVSVHLYDVQKRFLIHLKTTLCSLK